MKRKTLKALKASIVHWNENIERAKKGTLTLEHIISDMCPLCKAHDDCGCIECPVYDKTQGCGQSPWINVSDDLEKNVVSIKELVADCKKERDFLVSLLPKKKA